MKAILDTHVFLWWIKDYPELSDKARDIIGTGENEIFISVASGWEIAIKAGLGRLSFPDEPERFLLEQLVKNSFQVLPIYWSHAMQVSRLPQHHRDPFDRMLVAQAQAEQMPIISADPLIRAYDVQVLY